MKFSLVRMHYAIPFPYYSLGLLVIQLIITIGIKIKNFDNYIDRFCLVT
ncbi:MAG: hypothetical protein LN568_02140 [Rickettsia endosymbiont of Pseudomimeciton antennatum]|nr:hypothetical protein [Rickettsia endosymbiont of Pseudomimeciton antennatum]